MNNSAIAVFALGAFLSPLLCAQDGPPTFVPKDAAMIRVVVEDVPALLKKLPDTALGRLLAEPEVDEAFSAFVARVREVQARADAARAAAKALGLDTHDEAANPFMRLLDVHDYQRLEAVALKPAE